MILQGKTVMLQLPDCQKMSVYFFTVYFLLWGHITVKDSKKKKKKTNNIKHNIKNVLYILIVCNFAGENIFYSIFPPASEKSLWFFLLRFFLEVASYCYTLMITCNYIYIKSTKKVVIT